MACPRGKASPDSHTRLKLFAAAAGFCQNPKCETPLFIDLPDGENIHIAEMAHVFAANDDGPRSNRELSAEERGAFDNLILLCPKCHTEVDKAPTHYTDAALLNWKSQHAVKLKSVFGIQSFKDRQSARELIDPLLQENRAVFDLYGPHIKEAENPESGAAERWHRKVITRVLPKNQRILALLDANRNLLSDEEANVLEEFRQHVDDLSARHIEGYCEGGRTFPSGMNSILKSAL